MAKEDIAKEELAAATVLAAENAAQEKLEAAQELVKKYMWWSMGAGLIPVPYVDMATVSGVQLKMLNEISKVYGVKFSKVAGKSIITALLGGISADALSRSAFTSMIKSIPIIGLVGSVSMPIFSGATTWAIGLIFIQHFSTGGTFLDFEPKAVKEYFKKLFDQGQEIAKDLKTVKV